MVKVLAKDKIRVFYDGGCGLCHYFVLFTLKHMRDDVFIFSPQVGKTFASYKSRVIVSGESIIVYDEQRDLFWYKSQAVRRVLLYCKWPWKATAYLLKIVPTFLSDVLYDQIAKVRRKLFKKPQGQCPVIPNKWVKYFDE